MAAASIPTTSGIQSNSLLNKPDENARHPTVEELLIQIENHLYKSIEHRASLLIAVWSCLAGKIGYFRNMEKVFHMLYRESAMTIFCGHWPKINLMFKRGLSRALIHFSQSMGHYIKGAEGLCSALVMAAYDPWGDPVIRKLLRKEDIDQHLVDDFIKSEPFELLVIRVECLVNARFEEAAIRLCRCCLKSHIFHRNSEQAEDSSGENWRWTFMEWLLRLLFRKGRLNDLVAESGACSCHDGVRLIYKTRTSHLDDSEPLTETLINLFLVRDLLFQSNYCCTSELMSLWCDFQVQKQRSVSEIQDAAHKLLVGHASSSAQFYLFVDILWGKFGISLLPLYIEMYIRGLTSDLNYLEAARQADNKEYVIEIENHMAAMYFKLSSMFNSINKEIALECMLSSFSLDPTKERLDWIKKLSLQITKEKALKSAAAKNGSCKHKLCSKTGCAYPHPAIAKKKSVVMCDQAIQVGDELFENEIDFQQSSISLNTNSEKIDDSVSYNIQTDNSGILKQQAENEIPNEKMEGVNDNVDQNCHLGGNECLKGQISVLNHSDLESPSKIVAAENQINDCKSSSKVISEEVNQIKTNDSDKVDMASSDILNHENHCNHEISSKNFVPHNGEIDKNFEVNEVKNCKHNINDSKADDDNNYEIEKSEHTSPKHLKNHMHKDPNKEINITNHKINENGFVPHCSSENNIICNTLNKKKSRKTDQNCSEFSKDKPNNNVCNGHDELKASITSDETSVQKTEQLDKNTVVLDERERILKIIETCKRTYGNPEESIICKIPNEHLGKNEGIKKCDPVIINCGNNVKGENECKLNTDMPEDEILITELGDGNIQKFQPFTHIVLDSKIMGLSEDLLSDFVIVLESLRNRQLKSSNKWSQIKHLCEDYLETVTNSRYMMLNMQLNGSIDSETDSVSEITGAILKGFESHQSDDSVVEDHYADKSHVFKRFMHTDKNINMATYVNLSDIHCPQIPLEKLFYEHSSSHLVHKKRHKKHRNREKNPEKVVLKKLRHGSREHDLIKRKKRKKRKGKRTKGHVKKHHFIHGKTNKDCLKNKKKKHKLKKKKEERNSGFISGDYCSDFSSAELMRLVKEHSHSYSKLPATPAKHPRSVASSESDEPLRKKRKVSFDKKKQKAGKRHDKHKHEKSKSSKRKKGLAAIESCPTGVKNISNHPMHGKIDAVNDYSRIVQYASVKKMEAVQIRQRSVALNLAEVSKVSQEQENRNSFVDPCTSNSQLQHLVQQNFESSEDIMKMQLLMAQQRKGMIPISTNSKEFLSSANNQAVLKYVCSKMTSHLLSVAQSGNCDPSDSEAAKSPTPTPTPTRTYSQNSAKIQPQNLTSNVKHVIIERSAGPYKLASSSSSVAGTTLIPAANLTTSTVSDSRNVLGTVISGGITYPTTVASPQMATFTIPVSHGPAGAKIVTSKIVIPISSQSNIRSASTAPIALPAAETHNLTYTASNPPISGIIVVKNGNNTQIISGVQPPSLPCLPGSRVSLPLNRNRPNPVVTKTVPKIIKQAARKLSQPILKKPTVKQVLCPKPTVVASNSQVLKEPVVATSLLSASSELNAINSENISVSYSPRNEILLKDISDTSVPVKDSSLPEETSETLKETSTPTEPAGRKSPLIENKNSVEDTDTNDKAAENLELNSAENNEKLPETISDSPQPIISSSPVRDILTSAIDALSKLSSAQNSPKSDRLINSPKAALEDNTEVNNDVVVDNKPETPLKDEEDEKNESPSEVLKLAETVECSSKINDAEPESTAEVTISSPLDEVNTGEKDEVSPEILSEKPEIAMDDNDNTIISHVSVVPEKEKTLPQIEENADVSLKIIRAQRSEPSPISTVNLNSGDQEKQLQPITDGDNSSDKVLSADKASPKPNSQNKGEGGNQTSEAPTRSFTSISDAVRFSLMDMDDATDSVENQVVLQVFQASRTSSPSSPTYAASESGDEHNAASPSSAVMLSAPQSTNTTELNVSRVSQRFETPVHCSQAEKFTECQNTVSRTTSWILDDAINEASPAVTVQKSPEIDSCGEGKDDDKPKKKRKKKERVDNDITHKFWCQICSKGFFSAYNLRRHCRNVHKMDLPKGSSDSPFANTSQCLPHIQQTDTTASETSSSRLSYGNVQSSCVSPNKGSEYSMLSPTHEAKNQEFAVKSGQHVPQIQSAEFQMQTPPRMTSQSSSTHVSPVTPPKDFRLGTPTSVSAAQISPNKISPVKSSPQSKFQRLPTGAQVPQMAKISQMQQIALCGQQTLQQQRQIGQMQSPGLIQPLPSVACQAQQMQASQCPHFQANKQIVQQRIGQLQLMHHVAQLPSVPHASHGIQKPTQSQSFKKCTTNQQTPKMTENEQMQQAAQMAQNQQILANQQMQKLIQIRQNAIAASGIASQLNLTNAIPSVPGSPIKGTTQCFQTQLAAARQAAVVSQIPTAQRAQGTSYNLPSHETSGHQFFPPAVQPSQEQTSCPHSSFNAQNMSDFSSNTPSYPTIRLSSEANDGLEDLEQFLLENMGWSGEQSSAHALSQQSGNRPSSADSLTLSVPQQTSATTQNRGVAAKSKSSISRPKPRKPVSTPCSKNLLGNLGRGVKKKSCSKKKSSGTECTVSKPDVFPQTNLIQQPHELKSCNKDAMGNMLTKQPVKSTSVGILNETDSSDSVQCINVTHNTPKSTAVGINFNIFSPVGLCTSDKSTDLMCSPPSCKEVYDGQRKNSFLDHSNLVGTSSSNLDQNKSVHNINQCETNPINLGSAFNPTGKGPSSTMKPFCQAAVTSPYGITNEMPNPQDIFLGQRNSETSDSNNSEQKPDNNDPNVNISNSDNTLTANILHNNQTSDMLKEKSKIDKNLFLGGNIQSSDEKSELSNDNMPAEQKSDDSMCVKDNIDSKTISNSINLKTVNNTIDSKENNPDNSAVVFKNISVTDSCDSTTTIDNTDSKENTPDNSIIIPNSKLIVKSCLNDNIALNEYKSNSLKLDIEKNQESIELGKKSYDICNDKIDNMSVVEENCKENKNLPSNVDLTKVDIDDNSNIILKSADEKSLIPKVLNHDEHSSHENTIPNDENHVPKKNDLENINNELGLSRIALRVRKPQDASNKLTEADKNVQYFVNDKDDIKSQVIKKSSKKKKAKQENRKDENIISDSKISCKLDSDSQLQKTGLLNNIKTPFNKEKELNHSLCMITSCYDSIKKKNSIENEAHGDAFCLDSKQLEDTSIDGIPAARLRLRDTPKTSVKRVCPCCVDSKMPKKCRANGGGNISKIIGNKVSNALKPKSTLKTRNSTNGHNGKVNTRSSQRLRSRNNAIS